MCFPRILTPPPTFQQVFSRILCFQMLPAARVQQPYRAYFKKAVHIIDQ